MGVLVRGGDEQRTLREVHFARRVARAMRENMSGAVRGSLTDIGTVEGLAAFDVSDGQREFRIYVVEREAGT